MQDASKRVHIRKVSLGESPLWITYLTHLRICAVACETHTRSQDIVSLPSSSSTASPISYPGSPEAHKKKCCVHLMSGQCDKIAKTVHFQPNEQVSALCPVLLGDDPQEYLAVGTAFIHEDEPEPLKGRVLLLRISKDEDDQLCCTEAAVLQVPGAVYSLVPFKSMLLGSVNNRVSLWTKTDLLEGTRKHYRITEVCHYVGTVIFLQVQATGDYILTGDVMHSVSLLRYDAQESTLKLMASDAQAAWTTTVEIVARDSFLMADDCCNMYMLGRDESRLSQKASSTSFTNDSSKPQRLHRVGQFHAGKQTHGGLDKCRRCHRSDRCIARFSAVYAAVSVAGHSGTGTCSAENGISAGRGLAQALDS
eukprot:TRINITY_DN29012_c0_g1_i1.p1 TRINITY_DN29012_c0_g1~~TRINITY_DN29012_c0_g1_i1.p1  ORF type:complete len:414 (-),score=49.90 TRINITY_DN29012_c0_g1_i1:230-1324(-)